jgi:hypothetical protein
MQSSARTADTCSQDIPPEVQMMVLASVAMQIDSK